MSKSSGRGTLRGFGRRSTGTVTVLETRVHRTSARNARVAFILTAVVVALLTVTIASSYMNPVLALLLAIGLGPIVGAPVWVLVRIWPVLRVIWWWTPEIVATLSVVYGWLWFARVTDLAVRLIVVAAIGGTFAWRPVRRHAKALVWCVIVRHRLRTCFAQFLIANQSGTLPLILWAKPTPSGERVWIYLRTGLSLTYLQGSLEKIAVACHAGSVVIERVNTTNAAYVRADIKRREVLGGKVVSPLTAVVDPDAPKIARTSVNVSDALDLPDVTDPGPASTRPEKPANDRTTAPSARKPAAGPANPAPSVVSADGEDVSDLIDF